MGQAKTYFQNCTRQSFDESIVCNSAMIEWACYENIVECPDGYENIEKLTEMFGNRLWCRQIARASSNIHYDEIFIDSTTDMNGAIDNPVGTLYGALVNNFAQYKKIQLYCKSYRTWVR